MSTMLTTWRVIIIGVLCLFVSGAATPCIAQSYSAELERVDTMSRIQPAVGTLHSLLSRARAEGHIDTMAMIQLDLAGVYFYNAVSFDSAIHYCDRAISTVQESSDENAAIFLEAWYLKGFFYRKWDRYDLAKEALQVVLAADENMYSFPATYQMGKLYKDRGEFAMAFQYYNQALQLAGDDLRKKIQVYEYISFAYSIMETPEGARQAILYLDKLKEAVRELGDWEDYLPLAAFNQGDCYYFLGEREKAIALIDESERLLHECCDDPDFEGLIAEFRGHFAFEDKNYATAIDYYKKGLETFEFSFDLGRGEGLAGTYKDIAETYLAWNKPDSALHYINLAIADRTYGVEGNVNSVRYPTEAEMLASGEKSYLCEDVLFKSTIFESMPSPPLDSITHYNLLAELILSDLSKRHIEEETKLYWRPRAKNVYHRLIKSFINSGELDKVFQFIEKSKYVILQEHMRKKDFSALTSSNALVQEYQLLLDTISNLEVVIKNNQVNPDPIGFSAIDLLPWRAREDQLLENLRLQYPSAYKKLFNWDPISLKDVRARVAAENALFVDYFIHDSMSCVMYISEDDVDVRQIGTRKEITDKVVAFLSHYAPGNDDPVATEYDAVAYDLFHTVLDASLLKDVHNLIISADDVLGLIPFEALTVSLTADADDFGDLNYMLNQFAIRHVLNAKNILDDRRILASNNVRSFVPNFRADQIETYYGHTRNSDGQHLVGAIAEQEALSTYFPAEQYNTDVGERLFYEKTANPQRILHIASHAEMNDSFPLFSKLFFERTDDSLYDNKVHVFELKNKKIDADLVILSACETGIGKIYNGEGIISLGTAFRYAGCSNMVTSLWKIPDQASGAIMSVFYEKLAARMPKYKALQQAKMSYIRNTTPELMHPYFWSGLLYFGDENPLIATSGTASWKKTGIIVSGLLLLVLCFLFRRKIIATF